jgi:hypothetical protein
MRSSFFVKTLPEVVRKIAAVLEETNLLILFVENRDFQLKEVARRTHGLSGKSPRHRLQERGLG